MAHRLRTLGILMAVIGIVFAAGGAYGMTQVDAGERSLQKFSEAQNITLNYNEDGELVDRGTTEGAEAIMTLLTEDWGYPVKESELDPSDPLVNTASEYMYQMATIGYHVLHGSQTVQLEEDAEYEGQEFEAGTYTFDVDGRYWTAFDRQHPVEGPARGQAWSGTAHALIAELGVGTVTASSLQLGFAVSLMILAFGGATIVLGAGLIWASSGAESDANAATAS